ncbi:putative peroxisomal membrane protein Pex17 [Talaromyces proteolyticus]|uniref:Peroxisomal membrane protein Pex17 n=1 Tax=Talaromyces proteolyticus TaxID=1131652 RepID=A0AAD4KP58_9EURO|nr:putative peroxisomal membrane protein Pex17 [Talaromyces proteolyticus]KAH8696003.1 putative peroxisomal membrane protein Pex17 [Talaromyces proteolyticus]
MATERSLATLLRSLQTASGPEDAHALLPTATSFLAILTNPLNVTLLSSQLLASPAIWDHQIDLHTCRRILSVFNTAAIGIIQNEASDEPRAPYARRGLDREAWVKAVVDGADDKSPRWRHLILLGGVLLGFEGQNRQGLRHNLRYKLESGLVQAAQLALQQGDGLDGVAGYCITMILNYTFELLSDHHRSQIDYNRLLPLMLHSTFFANEGLDRAYFVGTSDRDILEGNDKKFGWPSTSMTYQHVKSVSSRPLVASLGPLSRLIAHAMENVTDPNIVSDGISLINDFARTLLVQWRQNKLSEVDPSEETEFLDAESLKTTIPELWRLLRSLMFSIVIILRAVLGRMLNDRVLAAGSVAPFIAMQSLHILRNLYFITSRIGQNSSSQYSFVNLVAIDILTQYPDLAENFLRTIKPIELGHIPQHPLERCLDLFFLNTAEHFTLIISPQTSDELIVSAATPYLAAGGNNHLLEIFEAAHSVALAVFSAPQNADIAAKHLPFYIDNLFTVYPQNLSVRQFRLAFRSVVRIAAPPSPLASNQPLLAPTLLELAHKRALDASSTLLPPSLQSSEENALENPPLHSERSGVILAIIDSLPSLRVEDLEEFLPLTARLVNTINEPDVKATCVERFWDVLSGGEMDVERANFCVTWWCTRGGRELLLFGDQPVPEEPVMSGAVVDVARESKL